MDSGQTVKAFNNVTRGTTFTFYCVCIWHMYIGICLTYRSCHLNSTYMYLSMRKSQSPRWRKADSLYEKIWEWATSRPPVISIMNGLGMSYFSRCETIDLCQRTQDTGIVPHPPSPEGITWPPKPEIVEGFSTLLHSTKYSHSFIIYSLFILHSPVLKPSSSGNNRPWLTPPKVPSM